MSTQNPINNPTAHMGLRETYVGQVYIRNRDPHTGTLQDDYKGYYAGDRWLNTSNNTSWVLIKKIYNMPAGVNQAIWVSFGDDIKKLTPDVGGAVFPTAGNINVFGTALQGVFTSNAGASTLRVTVQDASTMVKGVATYDPTYFSVVAGFVSLIATPGGVTWVEAPGAVQAMAPRTGYYVTNALCTLTLPATCPVGTELAIVGAAAGCEWVLQQNAGQQILLGGTAATTAGIAGGVSSNVTGDVLRLLCVVADTTFVRLSVSGNVAYG